MLKVEQSGEAVVIHGNEYSLAIQSMDTVRVSLNQIPFADLRIASAVHPPDTSSDVISDLIGPDIRQEADKIHLSWTSASTVWDKKHYVFECTAEGIVYTVQVEGQAAVDSVEYFDSSRGVGFPPSLYFFSQVFSPEVSLLDRRYYKSWEYACIDANSGPTGPFPTVPEENNHWIFTPPPFTYALSFSEGPWLAAGLAPDPGAYNFTRFQYWPVGNCFKLRLTLDGMTQVDGTWTSPRILLLPAADEYHAVQKIAEYLYRNGLANRPQRSQADWWSRPLFCGWGQQNMTAARLGGGGGDYARQDLYDTFMEMLQERNIHPGTIVIDDKWQHQYATCEVDTEKWPDMRGWIDRQHQQGRKVLLWYGAWTPEGLPPEECIIKEDTGEPVCADPSNPAYQKRLREAVRKMVSDAPGCLNADGFKVDWTNAAPMGPGFRTHSPVWGVELLKLLAEIIYKEAKRHKPDALIITHMANPYFAEVTDMLRLNDISAVQRDVPYIMKHRQKIALIANPDWLIDCDNSSAPTHDEWLRYTLMQPELGVPSLYFITGVDGTGEPIPMEDWAKLPDIWRQPGK